MSSGNSGQKYLGRNRAPRVQIEYDVELFGSQKKIELPFVMGVMAELSGTPSSDKPITRIDDRKFIEIDSDNFDERLKAIEPVASFTVNDKLSGKESESKLVIDLKFQSMDDFSPGRIANNVDSLKQLLEARNKLSNLLSYMDGKIEAEEEIDRILGDLGEITKRSKNAELDDIESAKNEGKGNG